MLASRQKHSVPLELDLFEPKSVGRLFVGDRQSISREYLFANEIGFVVCCSEDLYSACRTLPTQYNDRITLVDPTFVAQLESPQLKEIMVFIAKGLREHKNVLVFCESGLGKSAILISFFLMKTYHISLAQAINMIERAQAQRLQLNQRLSQLAVDFEMHLFNRNSVMVDQGSLLVLPEYVEGEPIVQQKKPRTNPLNLLGIIMLLFAVLLALVAQMPSQHREKVLVDIQNLVEEQTSSTTDSGGAADDSLVSMVSSLFKVNERQEMFEKCRLTPSAASEFLQLRDSLRQVVVSSSDVYQKSYTDYHAGVIQYERSSNLSSIYQQQLLVLSLQEQQLAQQNQLLAAADTVQKIQQIERQMEKLARERKSLVKDRLTPLRDDYYRRVKSIVDGFSTKNDTLHSWIATSTAQLHETQRSLDLFTHDERQKMNDREALYREQVRISQEEVEEARQQLQTLIAQSTSAMESLQARLLGVQSDLQAMDASLSEWTKIIDEAIAVASEGGEVSSRHLPQHHHRDHPHLIQALRDEIEAIRRTSQLGQQVFTKEIDMHVARYNQALEQLERLEQEKAQFELKVAQAQEHLSRWRRLLDLVVVEQDGWHIVLSDLRTVAQHSTTTAAKTDACLNVMSLEVTATIATNALSTGALVTDCTGQAIRDLQAHVLHVQNDVEPKHQQYIAAKNEHLKIVEKKRRFNDTIEAMEFQKESLVLQRKYQDAQRVLQDMEEEKRSFETIDQDIARREQYAVAAEVVWHTAERELQRWISDLRVEVAVEQRSLYPQVVLQPRLQSLEERKQALEEFRRRVQEAHRQVSQATGIVATTTAAGAVGTVNAEDDAVLTTASSLILHTLVDPIAALYDAEARHLQELLAQLAATTAVESSSVSASDEL